MIGRRHRQCMDERLLTSDEYSQYEQYCMASPQKRGRCDKAGVLLYSMTIIQCPLRAVPMDEAEVDTYQSAALKTR